MSDIAVTVEPVLLTGVPKLFHGGAMYAITMHLDIEKLRSSYGDSLSGMGSPGSKEVCISAARPLLR
ncbi:MAG TPA: hypothetical protein VFE62_21300 [Gemmataceae bacterium]|nr:hypothetical protein [Gemmataceae bacterium]